MPDGTTPTVANDGYHEGYKLALAMYREFRDRDGSDDELSFNHSGVALNGEPLVFRESPQNNLALKFLTSLREKDNREVEEGFAAILTEVLAYGTSVEALEERVKSGVSHLETPSNDNYGDKASASEEDWDDIRTFLSAVKPLSGCCWCGDESFHAGRSAIERLAVALETGNDQLLPTLDQCADILHYLSSIEPVSHDLCYASSGSREPCGHNRVLDFVQRRIREHVGAQD